MAADPHFEYTLQPGVPVGIAGAGTMGAGIAQVAALAGHAVMLYDARPGAAPLAVQHIRSGLELLAQKRKLSADQAHSASARLSPIESLEKFSASGLVVEAIVEDLDAKRKLFGDMERHVSPHTLLATNTSSLSITAIAASLRHPERLAGMHFFNPAPLMPLVEIVSGESTSAQAADALYDAACRWGKTPVHARSTPGFIVNRVARPFYGEALRLLEDRVADCATIDAVMREAGGFRMGPFELMDLIGNDVNYAVTRAVFEGFNGHPRFAPSTLQFELVRAGHLGRKSGRGFYPYEAGREIARPSTAGARPTPSRIEVCGDSSLAHALAERLTRSDVSYARAAARDDARVAVCDGLVLYRTDGRTATARAAASAVDNTVLIDLALDDRTATRAAIAAAGQADRASVDSAIGLLQAAGYAVSLINDAPGMIAMRTVAMLANEAAEAISQGVCSVTDLDLAMRKGVNYPRGPLAWANELGIGAVVQVLDRLFDAYGERYRASSRLRRMALAGARFDRTGPEPASIHPCSPTQEPVRG